MSPTDRLHNPDRREPNPDITPLIERRGGESQRAPQKWWERARAGALYGHDADGQPVAGVDRTGSVKAA